MKTSHAVRLIAILYWNYRSAWRKRMVKLQAMINQGSVTIAQSSRFDSAVLFQGKGRLLIEDDVVLGFWLAGSNRLPIVLQPREPGATIRVGRGTTIVNGTEILARTQISIGANCRIGARCTIIDADFHGLKPNERHKQGLTRPVMIGDNVWIGLGALVLKGVTIGQDAVVAAHCVVTKDVPAGAIVAGNPMRITGSVY